MTTKISLDLSIIEVIEGFYKFVCKVLLKPNQSKNHARVLFFPQVATHICEGDTSGIGKSKMTQRREFNGYACGLSGLRVSVLP